MRILNVVGARPNFMKIAPLIREMKKYKDIDVILVHTGQHYDKKMSDDFFNELEIPMPDINLGINGGTQIEQISRIMIEFEKVCASYMPDLVVVVGDVNSTIACALAAKKLGIKVAHVEAGLRSFDMSMPEEINRIITDRISDYLFVTERSGIDNLLSEGIDNSSIFFVGNVMIDNLVYNMHKLTSIVSDLDISDYCLVTMHRPSNVDEDHKLVQVLDILHEIRKKGYNIVWPMHPRTRKNIESFGLKDRIADFKILEPLGYLDFLTLIEGAKFVLTDSGGIQEETTFLNIPCLTMRENTERPITVTLGTNRLVHDKEDVLFAVEHLPQRKKTIPPLWDGKSAQRIVDVLRGGNFKSGYINEFNRLKQET